jgi:hypothetical protein
VGFVDLQVALDYLRVDPGAEDDVVQLLLDGASQCVADYLNRRVFATEQDLKDAVDRGEAGPAPLVINPAIRTAVLKIAADLYANREDSASGVIGELPLSVRRLLSPHRRRPGL